MKLWRRAIGCGTILFSLAGVGRAQQSPSSSSSSSSSPESRPNALLDAGGVADGVYRNAAFAFSYRIPFGWVERTEDMRAESNDPANAQVLLAVFEHPPEVRGQAPLSAVVIAAESTAAYHGMKSAADYFGPLTEVTTAKGFKVVNEPHPFMVGTRRLIRGDFNKQKGTHTVQQCSLVLLSRGYLVSFTFLAEGEDQIEVLLGGLNFGGAPGRPRPGAKNPAPTGR
jgi:hypothetical protein